MPEGQPRYFVLLTDAGIEMEARALAEGKGVLLTHVAVGDAGKEYIVPEPEAVKLVNEVWRKEIDSKSVSPDDAAITMLHCVIPAAEGGFWIREIGVYGHIEGSGEEVLYAYGNYAPYYKMLPHDGQVVTHEIIIPITTSSCGQVTIVVSDQGYATRCELEELRRQVEENASANLRDVELAKNLMRVANRVMALEISGGGTPVQASGLLGPEGYRLDGATIAPVTIVETGAPQPAGAALTIQLEHMDI